MFHIVRMLDFMSSGKEIVNVVARAATILAAVARSSDGARLVDLANETGIARPSVHRLLGDLIEVGYITQGPDRLYRLGSGLFMLGLNAPTPGWDLAAIRPIAQALADETGDTVYLSVRQFDGVHYLVRAEGDYPIRAQLVDVGDTKPYTSSYSGLALLSTLSPAEQTKAIAARTFDVPEGWLGETDIPQLLRHTIVDVQSQGWCGGASIVYPGVAGMAALVPSSTQRPYMAISISAVEARLTDKRIAELSTPLLAAANEISSLIP